MQITVNEQNGTRTNELIAEAMPPPRVQDYAMELGCKIPGTENTQDIQTTVAPTTTGHQASVVKTGTTWATSDGATTPTDIEKRTLEKPNTLGRGSYAGTQRNLMAGFDEM